MSTKDVKHMRHQFSNAVDGPDTQEFENMMKAYGTEVVGLVGAQVCPSLHSLPSATCPIVVYATDTSWDVFVFTGFSGQVFATRAHLEMQTPDEDYAVL